MPTLPFNDPLLIFATVMVLILLSPIFARRLRLPEIVGLILAGMVFGEHGLGLLERDETIKLLGQVGLLLIMFLCGLEIDLHQVKKQRSHSIIFGLLTFAIPLFMGTVLGQWALGMALPTAILMSSMFSSHTLLTFPAVAKLGLTKSRSTTTTIGGTIITDTMALLVLAIIAASTAGDLDFRFWVMLSAKITVYMAGVVILAPIIGRWFLRHYSADENIEFVAIFAIVFTTGYLAHVAGLEPIIGAFLAGLALNSLIPEKGGLMSRIHFTSNALFIPFFLLSVGMLVNVRLLWQDVDVWKVIAVMVSVALAAKWLAAYASGAILRYTSQESGLIFGMSVNQAAATLAAALVGYDIGLFDDSVITGTIIMIGVTCFVGPIITERFGRRLAASAQKQVSESTGAPHRVMLPILSREKGKEMLDLAFFMRAENTHEPIYLVNVVFEESQAEANIAHSENLLTHLVIRSLAANVPVIPLVVVETNVAAGILRAARENRASIISMFWDGHGHSRTRAFGHIIDRVVERSPQAVLVTCAHQPLATSKRILLLCPPLINMQVGFVDALATVKVIAQQSGVKLLLMVPADSREVFEDTAEKTKPQAPLEYRTYHDWKRIRDSVGQELKPNDWVMVMGARMGEIAWQPSSDRLPRQLTAGMPESNVSFIYPSTTAHGESQSDEQSAELGLVGQILRPERCRFGVATGEVRTALTELLADYFHQRGHDARRIIAGLTDIARTEAVELAPGLVLLHDRCEEVADSETFLVSTTTPMEIPQTQQPPRLALVLLDPRDQDPARHLAALASIAKMIMLPGFADQAAQASSYEDLLRRLKNAEAPPASNLWGAAPS